ncbi:MAG: hypothetical protein ACI3YH_02440, partial [Eubacteriales bacterium]
LRGWQHSGGHGRRSGRLYQCLSEDDQRKISFIGSSLFLGIRKIFSKSSQGTLRKALAYWEKVCYNSKAVQQRMKTVKTALT